MAKTQDTAPPKPDLDTEVASRLRDPFETAFMGVIRPNDPLLGEHGNNWQMYRDLRRDGKVFAALQKRVLALISRPWTVQPADGKSTADAEVVQDILGKFNFDRLCADLMDALLVGFAPAEVIWTVQDNRVVPARTAKRAQRRFVYIQDDDQAPPELRLITQAQMIRGEALPERKFIVHRVNPEDDNPYGTGLGRCSSNARASSPGTSSTTASARQRLGAATPRTPARRTRTHSSPPSRPSATMA
jgi:hypothetical protein